MDMNRNTLLLRRIADTTKQLVEAHTSHGGDTVGIIAEEMGLTRKQLSDRIHNKSSVTVQDVKALTSLLEDNRLIQLVCCLCGGVFVPNPHDEGDTRPQAAYEHAMATLASTVRQSGDSVSISMESLQDRICTAEEKRDVEAHIHQTVAAFGELLAAIQSMPESETRARGGF